MSGTVTDLCPLPEVLSLSGGSTSERVVRSGPKRRSRTFVWTFRMIAGGLAVAAITGAASIAVSRIQTVQSEQCRANLGRLGLALHTYLDEKGSLPAAALMSRAGRPLLSWRVAILPYLGRRDLFERFRLDESWDSPHNRALLSQMPEVYACPSDPGRQEGLTRYQVIVGPEGVWDGVKPLFERARGVDIREVTDGTSNTLMVVESGQLVPWTKPDDLYFAQDLPTPTFGSRHAGGFNVVLADGTARFLRWSLPAETLRSLVTKDGGEVVESA